MLWRPARFYPGAKVFGSVMLAMAVISAREAMVMEGPLRVPAAVERTPGALRSAVLTRRSPPRRMGGLRRRACRSARVSACPLPVSSSTWSIGMANTITVSSTYLTLPSSPTPTPVIAT